MKVKYIGDYYQVAFVKEKTYEVIAVEGGLYRIVDESGEDYLFYPEDFKIIEN